MQNWTTGSSFEELRQILSTPKKILITSHRNPDGDAIGSSLALKRYLQAYGHELLVTFPSAFPPIFGWMPDADQVVIYDESLATVDAFINEAELVFCLDFNALERIDKLGEKIAEADKTMIMIDHHLNPGDFATYIFSDTSASSTCELVYTFVKDLDGLKHFTLPFGECIFTGILTDTGSFKFSTSPRLYRMVADLLEAGVNDTRIQNLVYNCMPAKNIKLLGHCLANRMELLPEYRTGIITLTKKDYEDFDIQRGDTEGIVNYLLMMEDVVFALFIAEQPTIVKLSLRSKGQFSVEEIAKKHFRGGGHKNASGGASYLTLRKTVQKIKNLLPKYQNALLETTI